MYCTRSILLVLLIIVSIIDIHGSHAPRKVHNGGKIVGGSETTIQKYPYQAYLLLKQRSTGDYYQCGGSIVNNRCVITAAHCLTGMESVNIRVGSTYANRGGSTYASRMLLRHPRFNSRTFDYDIAVVKLSTPIKIDGRNASTITFPKNNCSVAPGTNVTVTGWGGTSEDGDASNTLMTVSVKAISANDCKKRYPQLTPRMLCAGIPEGGKDACQGDSGGPLVRTGSKDQLGVVSFGVGCARPNVPGVYSNLCNSEIQRWLSSMNCAYKS